MGTESKFHILTDDLSKEDAALNAFVAQVQIMLEDTYEPFDRFSIVFNLFMNVCMDIDMSHDDLMFYLYEMQKEYPEAKRRLDALRKNPHLGGTA